MVADDEEVVEAQLLENLKDLGMTEYEAMTLVDLCRLGTGTARDIANADDVPRTRVYDAVETLHEMGLVEIQYSTPRKFTVVSRETIVRHLNLKRENTIAEVGALLEKLGPVEPQSEQMGVWTATGRTAVADRATSFIAEADDRIVYMTVDDLLTDDHLDHLAAAGDRGVNVYIAGISEAVQDRIQEEVPSATVFETLWEWEDTPAGNLLVVDEESALVSVWENDHGTDSPEETAIWGSGERNSLVVVLRAIFTWRLEAQDLGDEAGE